MPAQSPGEPQELPNKSRYEVLHKKGAFYIHKTLVWLFSCLSTEQEPLGGARLAVF